MFWVRPRSIIPIHSASELYNRARAGIDPRHKTFILRKDIDGSIVTPKMRIGPCRIIGEPSTHFNSTGTIWPNIRNVIFAADYDNNFEAHYHIENCLLNGVEFGKDDDRDYYITLQNCAIAQYIANGNNIDEGVKIHTLREESQINMEEITIFMDRAGSNKVALDIDGGHMDISNVHIYRYNTSGTNEPFAIDIGPYVTGEISNIYCQVDEFLDSFLIYVLDTSIPNTPKTIQHVNAPESKKLIYANTNYYRSIIVHDIKASAGLIAQGLYLKNVICSELYLASTTTANYLVYLLGYSELQHSYLVSNSVTSLLFADKNASIIQSRLNVPAGKVGVFIGNQGSLPTGIFGWNKGFDVGTHLSCDAALADYTARFNSDCNFVNPKASFSNNA